MRDRDIRAALHRGEMAHFHHDPDTIVVDELGICRGSHRVDIAVVNGALHGYEIKSDRDTLARLPSQAEAYNRVFDTVTLVVGCAHGVHVAEMIPVWWGVLEATPTDQCVALRTIRDAGRNPAPDPYAIAQLLWKDEAVALLERHGIARGFRSARVQVIWRALSDALSLDELASAVRQTLKTRQGWREPNRR